MENVRLMPWIGFQGLKLAQLKEIASQEEFEIDPSWGKKETQSQLSAYMELPRCWEEQKERDRREREAAREGEGAAGRISGGIRTSGERDGVVHR